MQVKADFTSAGAAHQKIRNLCCAYALYVPNPFTEPGNGSIQFLSGIAQGIDQSERRQLDASAGFMMQLLKALLCPAAGTAGK